MMTRAAGQTVMLVEQAMQSGDADVVQPFDDVTHQFGRAGRFLGDRQVRRARGDDQDCSLPGCDVLLSEGDQPAPPPDRSTPGMSALTAS